MSGLERVDRPSRWPFMAGMVLVAALAAGLMGWYYSQRSSASATGNESPLALPVESASVATNDAEPVSEAIAEPVVVVSNQVHSPALTPPSAQSSGFEAKALGAEADILLATEKKDLAREKYFEALSANPEDAVRASLEEKLGKLNVEMIRLPWPMAEKQEYVVQTNDAIKFIARKFGTTVEMIVKGNELKRPDIIRPGQRLKVFAGKMEVVVSKSRHDLLLSSNGRFFKRYPVSTGRYEKTPVGSFVISDRIPEPPWHRDDGKIIPFGDKENILGTRWMAIKATGSTPELKGYGIHGTWDNTSIGKSESAGCIRLRNEDVEELFEMVPVGTTVVIEE